MAILGSVKSLIYRSVRNRSNLAPSRAFFSLSITSPCPIPPPFSLPGIRGQFLFRSRFLSPLVGPLFLSNPPWQLSQSATPLLLQSDAVLNFLKLRALNLLHRPVLPYELPANLRLLKENGREEVKNGDQVVVGTWDNELRLSYFNLPNYISFARLLSGPVLGWMITNDMYSPAFIGLAISGASDWLDGYVARKMRINSAVGSYLDPLADKVLIGCVALAMVDKGLLHPGLIALVLLRDVGLIGGAIYKRASSLNWKWNSWRDFFDLNGADVEKVEPLFISKVNTLFQLVLVAAALLQPEFGNEETRLWIEYLSYLVASTTVGSTASYAVQYRRFGFAITKKPTSGN